MIKLYQFAFSHFCEKARWGLDYKSSPYTPVNLLPGLHIKPAQMLAPKTCLPILIEGKTVVQDSAAVITYLDRTRPNLQLTPRDPREAGEALEWEKYLDEEIGVALRLCYYYYALPDRARAMNFMMEGAPWYGRPLFAVIYPKVREAMTRAMKIDDNSAKDAGQRVAAALDRLDDVLKDRQFLVGSAFSRADLAACALLWPYVRPGESDADASRIIPDPLMQLREQHKGRRFFRWVQNVYDNYRQPMRTQTKAAA